MFRRMLHTSCATLNLKKQAIKLSKMIKPSNKRKWSQPNAYDVNMLPSVKSLTKLQHEPNKQGVRRIAVLNKLFMKNITDIMSTGTISMDIVGRGIEISKVKLTPDLQTVNVFWVCKGDISDEETEAFLNNVAGALRHELSTLRVMGQVPYISFVKAPAKKKKPPPNKQEARLAELARRLAEADYGDDYTPTELGHLLRDDLTLHTTLSPEMKAKIKQLEESSYLTEAPLPEMTHNVYGLERDAVLRRLQAARRRTHDAWARPAGPAPAPPAGPAPAPPAGPAPAPPAGPAPAPPAGPAPAPPASAPAPRATATTQGEGEGDQREELANFLLQRKIQQNKLHKRLRSSRDAGLAPPERAERAEPLACDDEYEEEEYLYEEMVQNYSLDHLLEKDHLADVQRLDKGSNS